MESIKKFESQKLENLNQILGGDVLKMETCEGMSDKYVTDDDGNITKYVSNLESWFSRDKERY